MDGDCIWVVGRQRSDDDPDAGEQTVGAPRDGFPHVTFALHSSTAIRHGELMDRARMAPREFEPDSHIEKPTEQLPIKDRKKQGSHPMHLCC